MERITVTMQPLPGETRLLVMAGKHELMRAILGPTTASYLEKSFRRDDANAWTAQIVCEDGGADDSIEPGCTMALERRHIQSSSW